MLGPHPAQPASRRAAVAGFTLIELLIALIMFAIIGNAMMAVLVTMHRITRKQSETAAMQGSLRTAFQLLQTELIELAPQDLTGLANDRVGYRAMRGLGESCERNTTRITVPKASYAGLRSPAAGRDGVWVFLDGDPTQMTDDRWIAVPLTAVTSVACPGGAEGWALALTLSETDSAQMIVPGPIRTYEDMEIGQIADGGQQWLGIRSIGFGEGSLVPVSGPMTADGVRFAYLDGAGATTATPSQVRSMIVTLRGLTERPVRTGAAGLVWGVDSLQLRIRLRN